MNATAYAKLNLTLDILRRREDGYHDLQMVMQTISLTDTLTITPAQGEGKMTSNLSFLPTDGTNLTQKAAAAFRRATGLGGEVDISIHKHIPVCAGMAGGSADAAAVLRAMNQLTAAGLPPLALAQIGQSVGSDVPYCVLGGTALAEGRGERLTPLPALPRATSWCASPPSPCPPPSCLAGWMCAKSSAAPTPRGCWRPWSRAICPALPAGCTMSLKMCWSRGSGQRYTPSKTPCWTPGRWAPL